MKKKRKKYKKKQRKKKNKIFKKRSNKKYFKKAKKKLPKKVKKKGKKKVNRSQINKRKKKSNKVLKLTVIKIINLVDSFKFRIKLNIDLDKRLQNIFEGISSGFLKKIENIKLIIEEEKERKKQLVIKNMHYEKIEKEKKIKLEKKLELEKKQREFKEEIKIERERKKDLQKFIRIEQAEVRKEQADKQRKFLEQIRLEKKIEQFRKREAFEIKKLEKFVLSQERESYAGVQLRIDAIKQKYQALRDQKIKERIQELGIEVTDSDTRSDLLEKERQHNLDRQKIEFALESYYRSMASCVFQLNKKWITKKMSLLRVLDYRYESSEIFIKFDEDDDEKWLMLVYIKDNDPDSGIIVEDKTNPEKNISLEFKTNEIFKFSDTLVDSLTALIDRTRKENRKS